MVIKSLCIWASALRKQNFVHDVAGCNMQGLSVVGFT